MATQPRKAARVGKKAAKKSTGRVTPKKAKTPEEVLTDADITDVSFYKKDVLGVPLRLPSGRVMKVRNPGMEAFISAGIIPNSLLPIVQEAIEKGQKGKEANIDLEKQAMVNPQLLQDVQDFANGVALYCITQPEVYPIPVDPESGQKIPFALRDQGVLYVDEIQLEDKMFIFQYAVGGTKDYESFRKQLV